jgi:septum formation protein
MNQLILASTSIYRKQLLEKIGLAFKSIKPEFDEEPAKNLALLQKKSPIEIAELLSKAKAQSLLPSLQSPEQIIIAGDQLVSFNEKILGKSHNFEKAFEQLSDMNGKSHQLITAVTLRSQKFEKHFNHTTILKMKTLLPIEIENYLKLDEPYDCAGSYKIEKSGLILFEKIECSDFTAIQGLPLIWITNELKELGYEFFKK